MSWSINRWHVLLIYQSLACFTLLQEEETSYWYSGVVVRDDGWTGGDQPVIDILFDDGEVEEEVELVIDQVFNTELRRECAQDDVWCDFKRRLFISY